MDKSFLVGVAPVFFKFFDRISHNMLITQNFQLKSDQNLATLQILVRDCIFRKRDWRKRRLGEALAAKSKKCDTAFS